MLILYLLILPWPLSSAGYRDIMRGWKWTIHFIKDQNSEFFCLLKKAVLEVIRNICIWFTITYIPFRLVILHKTYSKVLLRYNIGIYNNQGFSIVWFLIDVKLTCQLTHLSTPKHLSEFTYNCQMSVAGTFYVNSPLPLLLCSRSVKQFPECVSCFLRWQCTQTKEGWFLRK